MAFSMGFWHLRIQKLHPSPVSGPPPRTGPAPPAAGRRWSSDGWRRPGAGGTAPRGARRLLVLLGKFKPETSGKPWVFTPSNLGVSGFSIFASSNSMTVGNRWVFYGKSMGFLWFFPIKTHGVLHILENLKPIQQIFTQEIPAIFWMGISSNFLDGASLTRMAI